MHFTINLLIKNKVLDVPEQLHFVLSISIEIAEI